MRTIWPAPIDAERRAPLAAAEMAPVPGAAPDGVEAPAPPDAAAPDALEAAAAAGAPAAAAAAGGGEAEAEAGSPARAAGPAAAARATREEHPSEEEFPGGVGSSELARSLRWDPYPDCIMAEARGGGLYDDSSLCWGQCGRSRFRLGEPGEGWYCCITCRDTAGREHGPYCEERHRAWAERNPLLIPFPFVIPEPVPEETNPFAGMDDLPAARRSRKRRRRRRRAGSPGSSAAGG